MAIDMQTFPAYFINVLKDGGRPFVRIYCKPSADEGMKPISPDVPLDKANLDKLIHDAAQFL